MKRLLATLLCATLVFSSGFSTTVYAGENASLEASVAASADEATAEDSIQVTLGSEDQSQVQTESQDPSEVKENTDEADDSSTGATDAADEASTEGSIDESGDASSEASSDAATEEISDAAADASSEIAEEELIDEDAADAASTEASIVDEELEEDELGESKLKSTAADPDSCFGVDADGKLILDPECTSLPDYAVIPKEAKKIPAGIFDTEKAFGIISVKFENGSVLEEIEAHAFYGCELKEMEIPAGVTEIKAGTFAQCDRLTSVTVEGNGLTSIASNAFENTALTSFSAPKVTSVGANAFAGCKSLKSVSLPSIVTIGTGAFNGCSSLAGMNFPSTIESIGREAFLGCGFVTLNLSKLSGTVSFGEGCFQENSKLSKIESFPEGMETIPKRMFYSCPKLAEVYIGNSITTIEVSAFEKCTGLNKANITNAYVIKAKAFATCNSLSIIEIKHNNPGELVSIETDSFPSKNGVVVYGYELEVQNYAEKKGYTFKSLREEYEVSCGLNIKNSATVKLSASKAAENSKVIVTVTPASGYLVESVTCATNPKDDPITVKEEENTKSYQSFSFVMTNSAAKVRVNMIAKADAVKGDIDFNFDDDYTIPTREGNNVKIDIAGRECKLVMLAGDEVKGSWFWTFTSSNPKAATVSGTGVIRSLAQGNTNITVAAKSDPNKKITIALEVLAPGQIKKVELTPFNAADLKKISGELDDPEIIDGKEVPVILFNRNVFKNGTKSFDVSIKAKNQDDEVMAVTSKWEVADGAIASVARSSNTLDTNTVTIKKGTVGETLVTVSVLNKDEKEASADNIASFIIRIADFTPRLNSSNITVDSNSTIGTAIDLVTVYGHEVDLHRLHICTKAKDGTYPYSTELNIKWDESNNIYRIKNINPDKPFAKTYSGSSQLYLVGVDSKTSKEFDPIPIPKLTVTNKALNPTVKATGKINLFYNATASADLSGKVTVTQSLSNLEVDGEPYLVSAENYKKAGYDPKTAADSGDTFANNFAVAKVSNTTFEITRTANDMKPLTGKKTTAGYIYIYYKGYPAPIKKAITVPVCDTAPDYVLNRTSATASIWMTNQEYSLQLVDKKTKKNVVSLANLEDDGLDLTAATTEELFEDLDVAYAKANDVIRLKVNGEPVKGKAVIYVKSSDWSRPLNYTFNLAVSGTLPTVKFSNPSVTLNKTYASQGSETTANIVSSAVAEFASVDGFVGGTDVENTIGYKASAKLEPYYSALRAAMEIVKVDPGDPDSPANIIKIKLPNNADVAKGTYTFTVEPKIKYENSDDVLGKAVSFKVVVTETKPTIKGNMTFALNAHDSQNIGEEEKVNTYTIGNLPTGVTGTFDASDVEIVRAATTGPQFSDLAQIAFDGNTIKVNLDSAKESNVKLYRGKSFKYKVHGLKAVCGADSPVLPDFTITLQLVNKAPTVKVKTTGTINPVDPTSRVTLTATVGNIASKVGEMTYYEIDKNNRKCKDPVTGELYSPHFNLEWTQGSNVAYLKADPDDLVSTNTAYKLVVQYKVASAKEESKAISVNINVTPKQVLPKIATDKTAATLYAGQAADSRVVKVKITKKSNQNVPMVEPTFDKSVPAKVQKAFRIDNFDPDTGIVTLKLVNPSALVLNTTYNLTFVTNYENQAPNSTGAKFKLKVTVKK